MTIQRTCEDPRQVGSELLAFWLPPLGRLDWSNRLALVEEIDERIAADYGVRDPLAFERISRAFTAGLVDHLAAPAISSREQALLYLNSAADSHRQAAIVWLVLNDPDCEALAALHTTESLARSDKRAAARHAVNVASMIAAQQGRLMGKLVDISHSGAKVAMDRVPAKGTGVLMDIPYMGTVAGCVVWAASAFAGLAFTPEPIPVRC